MTYRSSDAVLRWEWPWLEGEAVTGHHGPCRHGTTEMAIRVPSQRFRLE